MKKLLTLIVLLAGLATSASALEYEPESGLTFQGLFGLNMSNFRGDLFTNAGGNIDSKVNPSFNVGVRGEYMLPNCKGVFVNLGANFSMKGAKGDVIDASGRPAVQKARAGYIEIPFHVGYRYNFSDLLGVYADFGPYFALGICGKSICDYDDDSIDNVSTRFFRKDQTFGNIQRFDSGLGCRVGAEYDNHHSLTFGFDWGLTDMYTNEYRKEFYQSYNQYLDKMKNFNASITYGYRF